MYTPKIRKDICDSFYEARLRFNKSDKSFNAGKDTKFGRLQGMFTPSYWKRDDLFARGEIYYAYTFKMYNNQFDSDRPYITWILFSPISKIQEDVNIYQDILTKLREVENKKDLNKFEKHLKAIFDSNYEEPAYLEIKEPYNLGHLCYISAVYVRPYHFSEFKLGVNLVVAAKSISKEIMYLPERYWNEEYRELYYPKKKED